MLVLLLLLLLRFDARVKRASLFDFVGFFFLLSGVHTAEHLTCPWHDAKFDLKTGKCIGGASPLRCLLWDRVGSCGIVWGRVGSCGVVLFGIVSRVQLDSPRGVCIGIVWDRVGWGRLQLPAAPP